MHCKRLFVLTIVATFLLLLGLQSVHTAVPTQIGACQEACEGVLGKCVDALARGDRDGCLAAVRSCVACLPGREPPPPPPPPPGEGETVIFSGVITAVLDEFTPPNFQVGDSITGSYTFDPSVTDTDPRPNKGQFPNALISLSITVQRGGVTTNSGVWGEGSISTDIDDAADPDAPGQVQDQVSMASIDPIDVTPVDGAIPDQVFLQIAQRVSPPAQPDFLMDDAIPTDVSAYNTGELRLGSVALSGNPFGPGFRTIIRFAPAQ